MSTQDMPKMRIRYEPAECWRHCADPHCPYTHVASWHVEGIINPFYDEATAEKAASALLRARQEQST